MRSRCASRQHIVLVCWQCIQHSRVECTACVHWLQTSPHADFLMSSCRWTWPLCRSSFRRWPSGTLVKPARVRVRTASQEGWAPWASWITGWQRLAWTDRGNCVKCFWSYRTKMTSSADTERGWTPAAMNPSQPTFLPRTQLLEWRMIVHWILTSGPECWNVPLRITQFPWW